MKTEPGLVAPCGMNCAICSSYLAWKHDLKKDGVRIPYCAGCRPRGKNCAYLKKWCALLGSGEVRFCFQCREFPCQRLTTIDKRYRSRYRMSMIENLLNIKQKGMENFLATERERWKCPGCGGVISCHNGICFDCGAGRLKAKKRPFQWEDDPGIV